MNWPVSGYLEQSNNNYLNDYLRSNGIDYLAMQLEQELDSVIIRRLENLTNTISRNRSGKTLSKRRNSKERLS